MAKIYHEIMSHLRDRMLFADELSPPFVASIGAHLANLRQWELLRKNESGFFKIGREYEDCGVNVCVVSPSGISKSYTMKKFIGENRGILEGVIKTGFRGKITEAGFVGTVNTEGVNYGDAHRYRTGILAFNEISNLLIAVQQQHSGDLINQVLEALSERKVSKSLAAGEINYWTLLTMWGAIQPYRFDFSSGLHRRFMYVCRVWREEDMDLLLDDVFIDHKVLPTSCIKEIIDSLKHVRDTHGVEEVEITAGLRDYLKTTIKGYGGSHLDAQLMLKFLLGKEYLSQHDKQKLKLTDTEENKYLTKYAMDMSKQTAIGSDVAFLVGVLEDSPSGLTGGEIYWKHFRRWGYTQQKCQELISICMEKLKLLELRRRAGTTNRVYVLRERSG